MRDPFIIADRQVDKGLYPRAFCKIIPDLLAGDEGKSLLQPCSNSFVRSLFFSQQSACSFAEYTHLSSIQHQFSFLTVPSAAYCNIMHADGAGTKSSLAYLYWKETGDLSVWRGIAQVRSCTLRSPNHTRVSINCSRAKQQRPDFAPRGELPNSEHAVPICAA